MENLSNIGRIFYGIAIAAMGLLTLYYRDFPYFLIPQNHSWLNDHVLLIYISGVLLFLAGACIVVDKITKPVSLGLGAVFLLVFCFYFIPYQFVASPSYKHYGDWENAAKELALAGGAFTIALVPRGAGIFALTIISFSIDHFLYAKEAAGYIPGWIPGHVFWIYITGSALLGSGLAIILKIKPRLFAALLGVMIFIWVVILHIPKAVAAPIAENAGEVTSAFLALSYCGIAFVIAGAAAPDIKSHGRNN